MNIRLKHIQNWPELAREAKWSVTNLAKLLNICNRTLEMHFLESVGKTPKRWLLELRQERALGLLRDGWLVKEVAAQLGYNHPTHFSREFKKYWGFCPAQAFLQATTAGKLRVLV